MNLSKPGVFAMTDTLTGSQLTSLVRKVEGLGYPSFWFPEAFGRDPFALAAHILTVTDKLIVGTGIANVWKREPVTMIGAAIGPDKWLCVQQVAASSSIFGIRAATTIGGSAGGRGAEYGAAFIRAR